MGPLMTSASFTCVGSHMGNTNYLLLPENFCLFVCFLFFFFFLFSFFFMLKMIMPILTYVFSTLNVLALTPKTHFAQFDLKVTFCLAS